MKYQWIIPPEEALLAATIGRAAAVSTIAAQCLINRGQTTPESVQHFLTPRLQQLADPFILPDMAEAVQRLWRAREQREPLVIFGDYDVDGVTSTALLAEFLSTLGWQASHYLPNRMEEGYGLSRDGVENCLAQFPAKLLLAVDCGSTSGQIIAELQQRGVDVMVLDHHQLDGGRPPAVAVVNPQLAATPGLGKVPGVELCSVGLAFKLAHALVKRGRELNLREFLNFDIRSFLDLVALGTVADQVPLTGENRILLVAGLERLNRTLRPGLVALKSVAQVQEIVGVYEVGFQLGPRLNAAGRLETANAALRLLLARTATEAMPLATSLDACNRERQAIEKKLAAELAAKIRARFNPATDYVIVEGDQAWHIGVVGIVASRILQEFYRPTIVLGGDGDHWRGSGRSIEGFDLAQALRECDACLLRHGGHSMAAGVSIRPDQVDNFRQRLNEIARRQLGAEPPRPRLRLDVEVPLAQITPALLHELDTLGPFGQQNPPVHFYVRNLVNARAPQRMGREQQHLKLWVTSGDQTVEAVWWNAARLDWPTGKFALAVAPALNHYRGATTVQLKILDWRAET